MLYCRHCDAPLDTTDGFCPSCGSKTADVGYYDDDTVATDSNDYSYDYDYEDQPYLDEQGRYHNPDTEGTGTDASYNSWQNPFDDDDDYDDYSDEGVGGNDYYDDVSAGEQEPQRRGFGILGNNRSRRERSEEDNYYSAGNDAPVADLSLKQCLGLEAAALIPILGLVVYIINAFGSRADENPSRANVARSKLIIMGIALLLSLLLFLVVGVSGLALLNQMGNAEEEGETDIVLEEVIPDDEETDEEMADEDVPGDNEVPLQPGTEPQPGAELQPGTETQPGAEAIAPATGYEALLAALTKETHAKEWRAMDASMSLAIGESVITTSTLGDPVLAVTVYAKNQGASEITFGTSVFDYAVQDGAQLEKNTTTFQDTEAYTAYSPLQPGAEITVYLAYTLPNTTSDIALTLVPWDDSYGAQSASYVLSPSASVSVPR